MGATGSRQPRPRRRQNNVAEAGGTVFAVQNGNQYVYIQTPTPSPKALHQLPPDIADFTGRQSELRTLTGFLRRAGGRTEGAPVISTIAGKPGVGKSALAIRTAHRLKERFPHTQLYVNLRGADDRWLSPDSVLGDFLSALGVAPEVMPISAEARIALYRSLLADRSSIIVLDNARDERQVRSLLPAVSTCVVMITSRQALATVEGAELCDLEDMPPNDALRLLRRIAGAARVRQDSGAAMDIVQLCGGLPLAVRIVGAVLKANRHRRLSDLACQLKDERQRLNILEIGDLSIRASFALSYDILPSQAARVFRLLGIIPGADFSIPLVATVANIGEDETRGALERLRDAQLIQTLDGERYFLHDLLRVFSVERLRRESPEEEGRVLASAFQWYAKWIHIHGAALRNRGDDDSPAPRVARPDDSEPVNWFEAERRNLIAVIIRAGEVNEPALVISIAEELTTFFGRRPYWADSERVQVAAMAAARDTNDRQAEASALYHLGDIRRLQGRWKDAVTGLQQALVVARDATDRRLEAIALNTLGIVHRNEGLWSLAEQCHEQSLALCRSLDDLADQGPALNDLGSLHLAQGRWQEALDGHEKSLAIYRRLGDRQGEGTSLLNIGNVHLYRGQLSDAEDYYQQSLALFRLHGDDYRESWALNNLGRVFRSQGRWAEALAAHNESLEICRALGDRQGEARGLTNAGIVHYDRREWDEAIACQARCLTIRRQLGDRLGEGRALLNLGSALAERGEWSEALLLHEQSLEIRLQLGDRVGESWVYGSIGDVYSMQGQWTNAARSYEHALAICREVDNRLCEAEVLVNMGHVYRELDRLDDAVTCYERGRAMCRELSMNRVEGEALSGLGDVCALRGKRATAVKHYEESVAVFHGLADRRREEEIRLRLEQISIVQL